MHTQWLDFLKTETQNAPKFSANADFLCATEHLGIIQVAGEDALSFLQNQFSNDIAKIDDNTCQLNAYSSHKGRMYSIFYVLKHQSNYLLIVPKSQVDFLLQRLQMFVIMAKVTLSDVSQQWASIGYQSSTQLNDALKPDTQVLHDKGALHIRLNPNNPQRVFILSPLESAQSTWQALKQSLTVCTNNAWQLAEINEGIPSLSPDTAEAFVLQMANVQLINGVSFKKGCFPGQEIIARTKYLGKAKRRMYLAQIKSSTKPLPMDELCDLASDVADGAAKVVIAAHASEALVNFLMIGNIKKIEAHSVKLLNQPEVEVVIKKLPYSFEE